MTALTAKERMSWLLTVLPQIADEEWHRIEQLEQSHGPFAQQLIEDLRGIATRLDVPAGFVDGLQIYLRPDAISIRSNHFLRPVRLTQREAAAMELGLALLESERPPDERPAIERVRKLVRDQLTAAPTTTIQGTQSSTARMHANAAAAGNPKTVALLRRAMRDRKVTEIEYQRSGTTAPMSRRVHPYAMRADRGKWMLWAWCERSGERKVFRVDRMRAARATDDRFERPANADDMPLLGGSATASDQTVSVQYTPHVSQWIGERYRGPTERAGEGSALTVDHPLRDDSWAVRHVLQYGPDALVVKPDSIRTAIRDTLQALLSDSVVAATSGTSPAQAKAKAPSPDEPASAKLGGAAKRARKKKS